MQENEKIQATELRSPGKLDLRYFTEPNRLPLMVRRGARSAFELFLYLAHQFLESNGKPFLANHRAMCLACGIDPEGAHSASAISRLLRALRITFGVIDYEPVQRRRPQIRLAPATPDADILNPRHYVYFAGGWTGKRRAVFDALGPRAFAAEYMYWIATYESALAKAKHGRTYWFFPLEKISETYHVSVPFAGNGLRALVELGVMRVMHGQFGISAPNNEFGAANRYYFEGLGEIQRRQWQFEDLEHEYGKTFSVAKNLANCLANGQTAKNVRGLCELIREHGKRRVQTVVGQVESLPARSLKRRLAYVSAVISSDRTP